MVEEGYDVVIRVNPETDESLVGRVFLRDRLVVVASPALGQPQGNRRFRRWCAVRAVEMPGR